MALAADRHLPVPSAPPEAGNASDTSVSVTSDSCKSWGKLVLPQAPTWHTMACYGTLPDFSLWIYYGEDGQGAEQLPLYPEVGVGGSQGAGNFSPCHVPVRVRNCLSLWLGGGSALQLHQAFSCFLALRVAVGVWQVPWGLSI